MNRAMRCSVAVAIALLTTEAAHGIIFTSLYSFTGSDAIAPAGGLVEGTDGTFYGSTSGGKGTIFKITSDGTATTLHIFTGGDDNSGPIGKLVFGNDGNLYGVAAGNLDPYEASVFKVTTNGELTTLVSLSSINAHPTGGLILARDGNFYGAAYGGPYPSDGIIFKVTPAGALSTVYVFADSSDRGPVGRLLEASDGNLYGVTTSGGENGYGKIFRVSKDGNSFAILHSFDRNVDGGSPEAGLIQGADGNLYGTTSEGGPSGGGTVFKVTLEGALTTFGTRAEGGDLEAALFQSSDGYIYGTTALGGNGEWGTIFRLTPSGDFTTVYTFNNFDGRFPSAELIQGADGFFYGTTPAGGWAGADQGTVFKFNLNSTPLITLHRFNDTDGNLYGYPYLLYEGARLTVGSDGNIYGVTSGGGNHSVYDEQDGNGTIFTMTPTGALTTLYKFSDFTDFGEHTFTNVDGAQPNGALLQASDGNFYGVCVSGGTNERGTIFRITPGGVFDLLHTFAPPVDDSGHNADGIYPVGALVEGDPGSLYGVANEGGMVDESAGHGTLFKITTGGAFTLLHEFTITHGANPVAGLVRGNDGNFYGTTSYGGSTADRSGDWFRITPDGDFTPFDDVTHDRGDLVIGPDGDIYGGSKFFFKGTYSGQSTFFEAVGGRLMLARDGNFYGTAPHLGEFDRGIIYKLSPSGIFTRLYSFDGSEGASPDGGLVQGPDGNLYGTTLGGFGTIFEVLISAPQNAKPARTLNISTRMRVGTADNALIGGFIVTGAQPKKVLIRAIGPSLPVAGAISDPTLELHDSSAGVIAANDNWKDSADAQAIADTTIPPPNDLESAIIASLNPGSYTAVMRGAGDGTGVGLVEIYDLEAGSDSKLANISTRGFVETGDNVMIGGFITSGDLPAKVLVRAIGPSLANAGVSNALTDTTLELHDGQGGILANNDDWKDSQQADIEATTIPPSDDKESAIVATLSPGNYTAVVRGKAGTSGVGLVEVYSLQ